MRWLLALLLTSLALAGCATESDPGIDSDADGLTDAEEAQLGTDPQSPDTDGDGVDDFIEVTQETDPLADDKPALRFRPAVDLGSMAYPVVVGTSCQDSVDDGDCGLGEPSVEVDGAGAIYITGVCCVGSAPPLYVSRDGGETFQDLPGDDIRELLGVEMDLAVDEVGRFYGADIEVAGTFQVTVWEADGTYVRHTKWPAPPLVDRDWIRAEGDGPLYYGYNTGSDTNIYTSSDAGATWSPIPAYQTGYGLGNLAIWPGHEICVVGGSDGGMRVTDCSSDKGATWAKDTSTTPTGGNFPVPVFDEGGNLYVGGDGTGAIGYSVRTTGGWGEHHVVSPNGTHRMPWFAAGNDGALAAAWYGTFDTEITESTQWYVFAAASRDATAANPQWDWAIADPDPVFIGVLGRDLLDFLQIDMGPDGALHIAYSDQWKDGPPGPDGNEEQLTYVRSEPSPLRMAEFFYGP